MTVDPFVQFSPSRACAKGALTGPFYLQEIKEGVGADKAASAAAIAAKEVADENVRRLKAQVDALTEAANFLLQEGETAIYEQTLATVLRVLRSIEDRSGSRGGGGGSGSGGSASEAGVKEAEKMAADRAAARADAAAELAAERAADALKAVEGPASSSQTMWEYKPLKQPADGSEPEVQVSFLSMSLLVIAKLTTAPTHVMLIYQPTTLPTPAF